MKLLTMRSAGENRLAVRTDAGALDVAAAAQSLGMEVPSSIKSLIEGGEAALEAVREVVRRAGETGEPGWFTPLDEVEYAPCVPDPEKIVCVGLNYRQHALETNSPIPSSPVLFSKFNNALAGHGSAVRIPADAKKVDYEVELVIVVGRAADRVSPEEALSYVFGYCTGNDLSARDLQFRSGQWLLGKTCDGFAPVGPYVVTADEVADPNNLGLECRVNGEVRQSSNTKDMIFDCATLISYISHYMTLRPGDLIFTGTPQGVIMGYPEPEQVWLKAGDEVVTSVEGLGELRVILSE